MSKRDEPEKPDPEAFQRFQQLVKRVLAAPKAEVERLAAAEKRARKRKRG